MAQKKTSSTDHGIGAVQDVVGDHEKRGRPLPDRVLGIVANRIGSAGHARAIQRSCSPTARTTRAGDPTAMGPEAIRVLEQIGSAVARLSVGDTVIVPFA
jgi:hypothetical protein